MAIIVYGFLLALGLCIGSFLNVVILRMPEGLSVVHPPSRCPRCGTGLRAIDNIPVLSWLMLRGQCRGCSQPISIQYPLVELAFGLLTLGLGWWQINTWAPNLPILDALRLLGPLLITQLVLLACLFAATLIDARHYIIPLSLCWVPFFVAITLMPVSVATGWPAIGPTLPIGWTEPVGGLTLGVLISIALLQLGVIPRSYADYEQVMQDLTGQQADSDVAAENALYPHARRETLKELLFLLPPTLGLIAGVILSSPTPTTGWLETLLAALAGAIFGAGLVWGTRILGTLAFGKEAMGLGDVHLMAGVGAVLGWRDVTLAFFIAPFLGLLGTFALTGLASVRSAEARVIPYGPYLAVGSIIALLASDPILEALGFSGIFTP
ncbi:MAG: prepilin peptidase [Phycisphaeraceae bacterium]